MEQIFNPSENERFLTLYRQLEQLQSTSPETARYLKQRFYDQIETYRKLRNYLTHEQYRGQYPFCVSSSMCDDLQRILNLSKTKAIDIAARNVVSLSPDQTLAEAREIILRFGYSYLPILDGKKRVLGILTPSVLLRLEGEGQKKVRDHLPHFALEAQTKRFVFVARNALAHAVTSAFSLVQGGKRVGLAFLTEDGRVDQALLGVITPMDAITFLQQGRGE